MPIPNLLHPINVTVYVLDQSATKYDRVTKEAIGGTHRYATTPIVIKGQITFQDLDSPNYGDDKEKTRAKILFRYVDLIKKSWTPKRGDKVTAIGHRTVSIFAGDTEPCAHYPDQNGPTMIHVQFLDNSPLR